MLYKRLEKFSRVKRNFTTMGPVIRLNLNSLLGGRKVLAYTAQLDMTDQIPTCFLSMRDAEARLNKQQYTAIVKAAVATRWPGPVSFQLGTSIATQT
ncbi:hypothetical protein CB1_000610005 [Camelus ferus]|nr:hypothetical protein CB1_000610005 [Camelus ferus]